MFNRRAIINLKQQFVRYNSSSTGSGSGIPKLGTTPNRFNSKSSAFNLKPALPDGLFYHPAPAAPNPEITPKAFLPKSDIRLNSDLYYPEQDSFITENINHMPVLSQSKSPKNYNLDSSVVDQLQQMRNDGATRKQMKEKFNVSDNFISLVTKPNPTTVANQKKILRKSVNKWSTKTLKARKIKEVKKLQWERDL